MLLMKSIHDPRYVEMINHLKQVRKKQKISQDILADRLEIDRTYITKTETFVRRLDFIELCDWLGALEYDLGEFLREIGRLK
jgi:transcriptional regulator with XRE-family HTH domain